MNKAREEQRERSEKESAMMEMTMTSKSKILAQMQIKSEKLEMYHQHSEQIDGYKTGVSEQLIDRQRDSATKKERNARENE